MTGIVTGSGPGNGTIISSGSKIGASVPICERVSSNTGNTHPSAIVISTVTVSASPTITCVAEGMTCTVAEKTGVVVGLGVKVGMGVAMHGVGVNVGVDPGGGVWEGRGVGVQQLSKVGVGVGVETQGVAVGEFVGVDPGVGVLVGVGVGVPVNVGVMEGVPVGMGVAHGHDVGLGVVVRRGTAVPGAAHTCIPNSHTSTIPKRITRLNFFITTSHEIGSQVAIGWSSFDDIKVSPTNNESIIRVRATLYPTIT